MAIDHNVTRFAGKTMGTAIDTAIEYEPGADPCTKCHVKQVVDPPTSAKLVFCPGGSRSVVVDDRGKVDTTGQQIAEWKIDKFRDIWRKLDGTGTTDSSGNTDTDR